MQRLKALGLGLILAVGATPAKAEASRIQNSQVIIGNPTLPVCPTSNCPAPPLKPILATQIIHGKTTKDASQHEWLSTLGLLVSTGAKRATDQISGQKVGQYIGVMQAEGAGTAWALNTDTVRNAIPGGPNSFGGFEGSGFPGHPGAIGVDNGSIGYELDFTNWDADSVTGFGAFTVGQYFHAQGSYTSLSAIYLDAFMANGKKAWDNGIFFNGSNVVRASTFVDDTNAISSISIGGSHQLGLNTTQANVDMKAVVLRAGQAACFNAINDCITWKDGRLTFANKRGKTIFTMDEEGNARFAGKVTQNAQPSALP